MKSTFNQLVLFFNKIERRQFQFAYLILMLAGAILLRTPSDGGVGPY
jgi:hypothetical protein